MQLRRKQKEEHATEVQITTYETEQQQEQKKKDDKKRKEITKPNHTTHHRVDPGMAGADYATRRNGRTRAAIKDGITGTTKGTPQRRHAQSQRNTGVLWTRCNCHDRPSRTNRNEVCYCQRSPLIQDLASRSSATAQEYGGTNQLEFTRVFTYWEVGNKVTLSSSIPTD
jgi:hypothetical protein